MEQMMENKKECPERQNKSESFSNTHPASLSRSRKAWNLVNELSMLSRTASSSRALLAGGADAEPVAASASDRERLVLRRRAFSNSYWIEMLKKIE